MEQCKKAASPIKKLYLKIKVHLFLERNSAANYLNLSSKVESEKVSRMFKMLSRDENRHHKLLSDLAKEIESTYKEIFESKNSSS